MIARLRRGIDAGERFIHEIQIALLRERAGEEDALLLAAAERLEICRFAYGSIFTLSRHSRAISRSALLGRRIKPSCP